ncbi:MAG: hypothetical protein NT141_02080 [candidate division WWE3 bacterium]|nr:hypothetical protein [candidate division WWE3 bacterium]
MDKYIAAFKEFYANNKILAIAIISAVGIGLIIFLLASRSSAPTTPATSTTVPSEPVSQTFGSLPVISLPPSPIPGATPSAMQSFIDTATLKFPATARVYRFGQTAVLTPSTLDKLAVKLGFTVKSKPTFGGQTWQEKGNYLFYDSVSDGFIFNLAQPRDIASFGGEASSKTEVLQNLLKSLDLNYPDLSFDQPLNTPTGDFNVLRIVNNVPVTSLPGDETLITFGWQNDGLISGKFYYHLLQNGDGSFGVYPLKTIETALEDLKAGRATLATLGIVGDSLAMVAGINAASFTDVKLEYLETRKGGTYLEPVYAFSGTVTLADGRSTTAVYFVKALQ